ncbi:alkaline phosphatase family protein [Cohnella luojiensis]|uniref:Alkaline phosphatase family protein n=1 Tax=Cohnella luojiensis TaxID=652876 RepID=A0A4Y8LY63_9BACL|nr:alkaline phosphatase family protein [Cohnella luojiensis]TFE24291.1 alkaline phosphatase family protein [Cohnella luojiensis]
MRKWVLFMVILVILAFIGGCNGRKSGSGEKDLLQAKSERGADSKKVMLIVADSLMVQAIKEGIQRNQLPNIKYLIEHGQYYSDVVSSFPTMSVTIDSTIVTGTYPDKHRVPGLTWYSADERRVVNYGTGPMEALRTGGDQVLTDLFVNLNSRHLNSRVSTIYEDLAGRGLTSGSVNGLIYRGTTDHMMRLPAVIHIPLTLPKEIKVKGPDLLTFGSFANPLEDAKNMPDGMTNKMGFNNDYAVEAVKHLIASHSLPDFLYVYLPDMDQRLHKKGPSDLEGARKLDGQLQSMLQSFGSMEEAMKKAIIIIAGDSGMSQIVPADHEPIIDLPELLKGYDVLRTGNPVTDLTEIALAVNETSAYVYTLKTKPSLREIVDRLRVEPRLSLIAWKENGWIRVVQNGVPGDFRYKKKGASEDPYGQTWSLQGNPDVLDIKEAGKNRLGFGQYPDAMQRLYSAMNSHPGSYLMITAKPGYELVAHSSPTHKGGGGHGSLHQTESIVPLIICGTDAKPKLHRLVDLKKYLLGLLS